MPSIAFKQAPIRRPLDFIFGLFEASRYAHALEDASLPPAKQCLLRRRSSRFESSLCRALMELCPRSAEFPIGIEARWTRCTSGFGKCNFRVARLVLIWSSSVGLVIRGALLLYEI